MKNKIYVGNMNYATSNEELEELFGQFGEVTSVNIITDRDTGRSKGFGFVEMDSEESAASAIEELNGKEVGGRNLRVNEAIERERRPRSPRY